MFMMMTIMMMMMMMMLMMMSVGDHTGHRHPVDRGAVAQ